MQICNEIYITLNKILGEYDNILLTGDLNIDEIHQSLVDIHNRRSNNTTKTEMVVEMKSSYMEENAGEGRSLRSRRVNYAINEKTAIKKKIKSCSREVPLEIKMEKGNNKKKG